MNASSDASRPSKPDFFDAHPARLTIERAFSDRSRATEPEVIAAVTRVIAELDSGALRVATPPGGEDGEWTVHAWVKQAILLYFGQTKMDVLDSGALQFFDKIPTKKNLREAGLRVVPPAVARYGAHLEPGVIMMPSFVNIGAYVGSGTMVDTWATVGSCAQIGKDVHLAGGVGIGGVLEPPGATPVIIEDGAFIGSRVIVVEGVRVGREAVVGAGVVLTSSTAILDVTGPEVKQYKGVVPPRSVVIPGVRNKEFPAGTFGVPCALIIGHRTASTDRKVSLNQALRDFAVPV